MDECLESRLAYLIQDGKEKLYLGRPKEALDALNSALILCPQNYEVICAMGDAYVSMRRFGDAISLYQSITARVGFDSRIVNRIASSHFGLSEFEKAASLCERVLCYDSDDIAALTTMGDLCVQKGDPGKAYEYYNRAVSAPVYAGDPENLFLKCHAFDSLRLFYKETGHVGLAAVTFILGIGARIRLFFARLTWYYFP